MTDPVRVCYVIGTLDRGGAEGQLAQLAIGLDHARFRPFVCSLTTGGPLADGLRAAGVPVKIFSLRGLRPTRNPWALVRELWRLVQFVREIRPDIMHGWLMHAYVPATIIARLTGVPIVVSSRRSLSYFKQFKYHWRIAEKMTNRLTDRLVANSEAVRADTIAFEGVDPSLVDVIYNGIDPCEYDAPPDPALIRALGLGQGPVVVAVANFIRYKGHSYLLQALALVRRSIPSVKTILVGDGAMRSEIEAEISSLQLQDSVFLVGSRGDVARLLANADLLVHPSTQEGFCNAILEGMAAGKPVVATAVGGNPEAVVDAETGLLVAARDAEALAAAIVQILENPERARAMGMAGRQRVKAVFPIDRMVQRYEQLYDQLVRSKGRRTQRAEA